VNKERGASVLEYTILVSLVVLVVVGAMTALGRQINHKLPEGAATAPTTAVVSTTCPPAPTTSTTTTAPGSTTTAKPTGC
jgi:Flp pilus assembly pilin Flp